MSYQKQIHSTFSHIELFQEQEAKEIAKAKNIIETTGIVPVHLGFSMRVIILAYNKLFRDEVS